MTRTSPSRPTFQPVANWGNIPHGISFAGSATSVAVDREDRIYVFNRGTYPLTVFDPDGNLLRTWGDANQYGRPHSITIHDDAMFLVDDGAHVVEKRTLDGELIFSIGNRGRSAPWQGGAPFNRPTGLAVEPTSGDLYVSDGYGNSRIHRFDANGKQLQSWGEPGSAPGQFSLPHGLVVTDDGRVVVCDRENFRVQVFTLDGEFLDQWHFHRPACIALVGGLFFVGEHSPHRIQRNVPRLGCCIRVLQSDGTEVGMLGGELPGHGPGEFMDPHAIAADSRGDIYVAEVCNSWLESLDGPPPLGEWTSLRKWSRVTGQEQ